ncbi:hypothetical protein ACU686_05140 [Yinghuangia aomiensis]
MTLHRRPQDTAGAALVPGYITTARPTVPEAWRRPYRPTTVILVAWGADPALAGAALHRGQAAARERHHPVRDTIASHTKHMSDGILCDEARSAAELYEMGDGAALVAAPALRRVARRHRTRQGRPSATARRPRGQPAALPVRRRPRIPRRLSRPHPSRLRGGGWPSTPCPARDGRPSPRPDRPRRLTLHPRAGTVLPNSGGGDMQPWGPQDQQQPDQTGPQPGPPQRLRGIGPWVAVAIALVVAIGIVYGFASSSGTGAKSSSTSDPLDDQQRASILADAGYPPKPDAATWSAYISALDAIDPDIVHLKQDKAVSRGRDQCGSIKTRPADREYLVGLVLQRFTSPGHPEGFGRAKAGQILDVVHEHLCPTY